MDKLEPFSEDRPGIVVQNVSCCHAGGRELDSGRTITQGLKITEEKVLPRAITSARG